MSRTTNTLPSSYYVLGAQDQEFLIHLIHPLTGTFSVNREMLRADLDKDEKNLYSVLQIAQNFISLVT